MLFPTLSDDALSRHAQSIHGLSATEMQWYMNFEPCDIRVDEADDVNLTESSKWS